MRAQPLRLVIAIACASSAAFAFAQNGSIGSSSKAVSAPRADHSNEAPQPWVAPGTPGSPINRVFFHAQVLMSAHGFSPGVIDGKEGESFKLALSSFQEARGLSRSGKLDGPTRLALLEANRPSTVMVRLGPQDVRSEYVSPFPQDPEAQAELKFLGYRNVLEKLAERYHTTPRTIVALNGPDKLIGEGQLLRLPNVVSTSRTYEGTPGNGGNIMAALNVEARQPEGDYVVVDKSEGVLKVYRGEAPAEVEGEASGKPAAEQAGDEPSAQLVAAFPVTMGSKRYPLPIGRWKATTYAFLPPFHYQPEILNNPKTDKELRLPPGPNGPVGVAWLDLTKEHYGIHGTNEPQTIGRAESSGCIRMTNWDVVRLARMMKPGFTAIFQA
jgi:lipoprotein-anchoring transpeptidase ErfK/SrfK